MNPKAPAKVNTDPRDVETEGHDETKTPSDESDVSETKKQDQKPAELPAVATNTQTDESEVTEPKKQDQKPEEVPGDNDATDNAGGKKPGDKAKTDDKQPKPEDKPSNCYGTGPTKLVALF